MHTVKGPQPGRQQGIIRPPEHPLGKHIQDGHHGNAEQRPHDPPAEGIHAEYQYAQGNDKLAQRRVGPFVYGHVVDVLIGRPGMVDLVKDHSVVIAGPVGHGALFIHQSRSLCRSRDREQVARLIKEGDLVDGHLSFRLYRKRIGHRQIHRLLMPLEHSPLILGVGPALPFFVGKGQRTCGNVPVAPGFGQGDGGVKGQGKGIPRIPVIHAFGEVQGAQIQKGNEPVQQRQYQQADPVRPDQLFAGMGLKGIEGFRRPQGILFAHFCSASSSFRFQSRLS